MEINFLKSKKETPDVKKEPVHKFAIEYKTPPLAPEKLPVKKVKKVSWWKKIFPDTQPVPATAPVAPIVEKPRIKLAQKKEAGVFIPPSMPKEGATTHALNKKDLEKIKKGEYAASFLDVNLIPRELAEKMRPLTKIRRLLWAVILSWLVVFILYGGMLWYQGHLMNNVQQVQLKIKEIDSAIESYQPWQKEALAFNTKVEDISKILDQHIYWTAFFSFLEANTLPEVKYQNLSGDVAGVFTLSATAPNYETIAKQIALFQNSDLISDVSVSSATAALNPSTEDANSSMAGVKFNISLTVKPDVFYKKNEL